MEITPIKLKAIGGKRRLNFPLFSSYLAEFMWRYMHKDEDVFEVFLQDVKKIYKFV